MAGDATLQQILMELQQAKGQPRKPWEAPQPNASPAPMAPAPTPAPTAAPGPAPVNPQDLAMQLMNRNKQLAPMGTETGMVGNQGQGISAQDATLLQKLMRFFGM